MASSEAITVPGRISGRLRDVSLAGIAIVVSVVLMAIIFALLGASPVAAYRALLDGSLASKYTLAETLMAAVPLILCGLAAAIPFRAGLWNIGGEGQLYAGAFTAAAVALSFPGVDATVLTVLALGAGTLGGALWASVAGVLKAWFDTNEVIVTLMLNYSAIILVQYATDSLWTGGGISGSTRTTPPGVELPGLWGSTPLNLAFVIAICAAVLGALLLQKTAIGFALRLRGFSTDAARLAGFRVPNTTVIAFCLGGACAGLAGACQVIGVDHLLASGFSPGYGYTGIAVALAARLNPLWILPAAFFFAVLVVGGYELPVAVNIDSSATSVMQAAFILLLLTFWVLKPNFRNA